MPTPSSNQPPDPMLSAPFNFSTCPDDIQYPARSSDNIDPATSSDDDRIEVRPDSSLSSTSPPARNAQVANREQYTASPDVYAPGRQASIGPSSRATTVSPGPQSTVTGMTSPLPSGLDNENTKACDSGIDGPITQSISLASGRSPSGNATSFARDVDQDLAMADGDDATSFSTSMGIDFPSLRTSPITPSSYLRPGSRFHGTQQSERQVYEVQVEIKHVDMRESFLCGYLRIQGLTEDHPTLTTYFEGEIIGSKYGFVTQHEDWGASLKTDMNHWSKFSAFRPYQKHFRKGPVTIQDVAQRENIFMRWKEHFLVPDHRVRTITGASFEGFYYICFNQLKGEVNGIYFHSKSEKFQQLELKHVPNRGCFSATEFR
ncbi:hypothetical protein HIM_07268 [Hirsutella minnesotensis 3608]|uniref:Uncharacterized protein n=1 Tax=Hirsutella minnesotensis 3608 TaxID=1043627 RepID=A0A0F8A4B0_9HYPO|nr:hypothetical protein HIM_07268 [Hirsutella minnesotensis 3608]